MTRSGRTEPGKSDRRVHNDSVEEAQNEPGGEKKEVRQAVQNGSVEEVQNEPGGEKTKMKGPKM